MAWPVLALTAAAGLALGSYGVTLGVRMARAEGGALGRSHCDECGIALGFAQTVPVLSYIRLRGACAQCGARIDPTHVAGELLGAGILITAMTLGDPLKIGLAAILGLCLLVSATIDLRTQRLPDGLTVIVAICAAGLAWRTSWAALEMGAGVAGVTFLVLELLGRATAWLGRPPGLGFGDVKLICALSIWLGLGTSWMVAGASLLGLGLVALLRPAGGRLPFGPAIAAAAWAVGLTQEWGWWLTT